MTLFREKPDLLPRFRTGERAALEEVYWAYVDRIERLVRGGFLLATRGVRIRGAEAQDVPDLVQEVFARAFSQSARLSFDGLREYAPYLTTIARNLMSSWSRSRGVTLAPEQLDQLEAGATVAADDAPWADPETMRCVTDYLSSLPPELKAVHEARYVRGLSQEEAARSLAISRQQLRTREGRLRDGLRVALKKAGLS